MAWSRAGAGAGQEMGREWSRRGVGQVAGLGWLRLVRGRYLGEGRGFVRLGVRDPGGWLRLTVLEAPGGTEVRGAATPISSCAAPSC